MKKKYTKHVEDLGLDYNKVINIYPFGSINYGTFGYQSDHDYIIVYEQEELALPETIFSPNKMVNCALYNPEGFQMALSEHMIDVVEAYFLDRDLCYITQEFDFKLDKEKLRRRVSQICSNSWVKCKKKLAQGDTYIGLKSIFHSLRISDYGIQIAKFGKIKDYRKPQYDMGYDNFGDLWRDIRETLVWDELETKYKKLANSMRSEIRTLMPLDKDKRRTKNL